MKQKVHVQVKDNSPSIERILRPITYISWLLGVGIAHPQKCPKAITIIIHIIHMGVCLYYILWDASYIISDDNDAVYMNTYIVNQVMCCISTFYYIYYGIRQCNKWPELMSRLKKLDEKIREEISMNDRSIKIVEALAVFMTFTFCPLIPIIRVMCYLLYYFEDTVYFIQDTVFYYILAQSLINSFVFDVVVYVLYRRFQTLNKLIGQLDKLSDIQCIAFKIRRIRELHADICDLASMVNDIHSLHLLFCFGNCFTMIIASVYDLYHYRTHVHWIAELYSFSCIVYSMQFCLICWICTLACEESNRTGRIIHKIILNCKLVNLDKYETSNQSNPEVQSLQEESNSEQNSCSSHNPYVVENFLRRNLDQECITKEVNNFSIQLQQNRVAFTACDFFEIDNSSSIWFVGVIVTYLFIVLPLYQGMNPYPD